MLGVIKRCKKSGKKVIAVGIALTDAGTGQYILGNL
jgi:hypothetical protein